MKIESLEDKICAHADGDVVRKAPKDLLLAPTFRIDPKTRGVANVAVFFKFTDSNRLPIHPDDKVRKDPIVMDAPFLVYQPHMVAVYPEWFDGTRRGTTGQKFIIRNFSPVPQAHHLISQKNHFQGNWRAEAEREFELTPERLPIIIQDNIHFWMRGYVWVFDHPYFAITKDDGSFTIPRVPGGVEVQVMAWHEYQGWLFTKDGKTMKLTDGKNILNFEMGAK